MSRPARLACFALALVCCGGGRLAWTQTASTKLQDAVAHAMAGQRGTAVLADVQSGRVLAAYHLEVAARRLAYPGSSIKPFTLEALRFVAY